MALSSVSRKSSLPWRIAGFMSLLASSLILGGCPSSSTQDSGKAQLPGFEVKVVVGSALTDFCKQATDRFNQQKPKLQSGAEFYITCEAKGSGDIVTNLVSKAQQVKSGALKADAPELPVLVSVDGEVYQSQLSFQLNQLFPGQNYVPEITDAPLLASSPMVFMVPADLANGLRKADNPFQTLATAKTHKELDPAAPPLAIHYVQTAPTRSNSGLQTLIAQFAAVSGKRPEQLTVADVTTYQGQVQQIQSKVTRYGVSTNALARAMVQNGNFWATVGSVYESSVIDANSNLQPGQPRYEAVYPKATFSSNMRAILLAGPWVSADEKAGAQKFIDYLRTPEVQQIAASLGLRPGVPGVPLGPKFTAEFGVNPQAAYDSYRPPNPEVVEAMLKSWLEFAKKPSLVVLVVDTSGSMEGTKITTVQQTLQSYVNSLGPKDRVTFISFSSNIQAPVEVDGTPQGKEKGIQFISGLKADGGTSLYDAILTARKWLKANRRPDAINAVLVLTDGEDSGSGTGLNPLLAELKQSGFQSDERLAFFTIGYGNEGEFNPDVLKQVATAGSGYYRRGDPATIANVMADLQVEF